jgi:hypothetical protein
MVRNHGVPKGGDRQVFQQADNRPKNDGVPCPQFGYRLGGVTRRARRCLAGQGTGGRQRGGQGEE